MAARTDAQLQTVVAAIADGIARIEQDPCIGERLRGVPEERVFCELRIGGRRPSWRILYSLRPPGSRPNLYLIGEHYMPTEPRTYVGRPRKPKDRLAVRAGFPDVYVDLARSRRWSEAQIRAMLDEVKRGVSQQPCC